MFQYAQGYWTGDFQAALCRMHNCATLFAEMMYGTRERARGTAHWLPVVPEAAPALMEDHMPDEHVAPKEISWKEFWEKHRRIIFWSGITLLVFIVVYIVLLLWNSIEPPDSGSDLTYCLTLAKHAAHRQELHLTFGWMLAAVTTLIAGFTVAKANHFQDRIILVPIIAMLGLTAQSILKMSDVAGKLAADAISGQTLDNKCQLRSPEIATLRRDACAIAWGQWVKARDESSALARSALDDIANKVNQSANDGGKP